MCDLGNARCNAALAAPAYVSSQVKIATGELLTEAESQAEKRVMEFETLVATQAAALLQARKTFAEMERAVNQPQLQLPPLFAPEFFVPENPTFGLAAVAAWDGFFKREAEKAEKAEKPPRPAPALQPDGPTRKKNKRWPAGRQ
eukprot:CAMPEP_0198230424 /NCGR_PEP_ID=MMETSP1445-20131203/114655_1 /TAXON_ID=36898 /ORGANISM="Pyramimonas sp., Strain CCMP2087" /LENGTH=143 /DNA_ID=CAMNT_0043910961 /DNA_START=3514 /DNA_END=3944 /DNA_ORIENTATION=+